jgi:hypothetical protein
MGGGKDRSPVDVMNVYIFYMKIEEGRLEINKKVSPRK